MYIFAPVPGIAVTAAKVPARIATNTVLAWKHMYEPGGAFGTGGYMETHWGLNPPYSPGGGGPGLSPISTNPPPSLEATGASLTQPGKTEGPARSSKRGSRSRRKKCPTGHYWSKKHRRCLPRKDKWFFEWR